MQAFRQAVERNASMEQQRIQQLTEANDVASAAAQKLAEEAAELRLAAQIEASKAAEIRKQ